MLLLSIAPVVPPAAPAVGEPALLPFGEPAILPGMPFFVAVAWPLGGAGGANDRIGGTVGNWEFGCKILLLLSDIWAEISVAGNVLVLVYSVSMDTLPDIPKMSTGPPIEGGFAPLPPFPSLFGRTCSLFSAIAVHALAIALCVLMWVTLTQHLSPDKSVWAWRTFPLHPILMVLAFGLIAPIAAAGWATYERHFDMPHWAVKAFHGTLMLTATVTGTVGVVDMWLVHEDSAQAQHDNGYSVHFQSAHSWVGIAALSLFILQATGGIAAFAMPRGEKKLKRLPSPELKNRKAGAPLCAVTKTIATTVVEKIAAAMIRTRAVLPMRRSRVTLVRATEIIWLAAREGEHEEVRGKVEDALGGRTTWPSVAFLGLATSPLAMISRTLAAEGSRRPERERREWAARDYCDGAMGPRLCDSMFISRV
ncbi:hypothetical protein EMIHUDRAFT_231762 [Emiliania huxleyi CCMP1516]|uniref:Cytochrome b561 domain-containing protein n=2 Tax=Emiliania huxleyi TaxID=2903 RepID=A0A0D3K744_EMIH1|nr:hypothetical protein EMIHUDRAFT_231762 [Emiliania huxleyi CCMP1516]EOD31579.1 hypothetical protein EMIHUDRAFT_231762 [Emiliania huxleyi CCMP1516]|eukprot:XP_005784008.1 hypothetical protein EMIHUDRAFT_231762 [Emiliania huxleyi CCMP1516]